MQKHSRYLVIPFLILFAASCSSLSERLDTETPEVIPSEAAQTDTPPAEIPPTQVIEPSLSSDLVRGCDNRDRSVKRPQEGEPAIEFTLKDVDGNTYTLSGLLKEKPVVMVLGSFNRPPIRRHCAPNKDLFEINGDQVHILVI